MSDDLSLVRFGELGLKGANRPYFERALRRNVKAALRGIPGTRQEMLRGRLLVHHRGEGRRVREALRWVCGIQSISPVHTTGKDAVDIERTVVDLARSAGAGSARARTFAVRVKRADKSYPVRSIDLERRLGARVLDAFPSLQVDLERPELVLGVDLRPEGCFVHGERLAGPGGLPVGVSGRAVALLSGGIDSPVAAYLASTRGLALQYAFFHSPEFTGTGAAEKVERIARHLARFQPLTVLHIVPFGEIQRTIRDQCKESYRTVLYRRAMHRIADRIAAEFQASALVSGDSLAQVASQTLPNLQVTANASAHLVLRPLVGLDKETTIGIARRIGTYALSILDEPDCCTLFQPRHPVLRATEEEAVEQERGWWTDALVDRALAGSEQRAWRTDGTSVERGNDEATSA